MTRHANTPWLRRTFTIAAVLPLLLLPGLTPLAFGYDDPIPITGDPAPGLEAFDDAMTALMQKYGLPGAVLAVVREEPGIGMRVVLQHGYGYANKDTALVTQPDSKFRIASISKPLTAVAILKLVQQGKLTLDTKVSDILHEFKTPASGDARIANITIRNLLQHMAGWDIGAIGFDPMYSATHLGLVGRPGTAQDIINYMLTRRLDFAPGSKTVYSNFGYCVLGRVIEQLSDGPYGTYVSENVTGPLQMTSTALGGTLVGDRLPFEAHYYDYPGAPLIDSVFDAADLVPWPYGGFYMPANDASGGCVSTSTDLLRFLVSMNDAEHAVVPMPTLLQPPQPLGEVPPFNLPGQNWGWYKTGSHPGSIAGLRLYGERSGKPRTYWCFIANTRPNGVDPFADFETALNSAVVTVEDEGHFGSQGQPLWQPAPWVLPPVPVRR